MTKRLIAALLAASFAMPSAPAFAQAAAEAATDVAPVTVRAPREPPPELLPAYAACISAMSDPYVVAMMSIGDIDARPRIFIPTRPPRNPDYDAPPKSRPGSPLPDVLSLKEYQRYAERTWRLRNAGGQQDFAADAADASDMADTAPTATLAGGDTLRMRALAKCLQPSDRSMPPPSRVLMGGSGFESGPSGPTPAGSGRMEIQLRDKTLPLGFALFDEGRYEEALEQFKAADRKLGGAEAPLMIGKIYLFGLKEKSDPVEGVKRLKWVADLPFNAWNATPVFDPREPDRNTAMGEAAMILAAVYRDGHGPIPSDPALSREYLEKAYTFGHIPAAKILGDIYYEGQGAPRDLGLAFKHYKDAAKFAYIPAMLALADMYAAGEVEGGPNREMALAWRSEAAKLDDANGLYALAVAYDRGEGVKADPDRALSLYKLAAMNGNPAAMTSLGTYFYGGEGGLPQDHAVARQWFEQAALAADADGMFNLAAMMAKGEGGAVDRVRAWGWLKIAERQGHPSAAAALQALEARFEPADRDGVVSLTAAQTAAPRTQALGVDPESMIDPDFVGTAPGGPPWWKVTRGGATVWILGLPAGISPLDERINTPLLRRKLGEAKVLLTDESPGRSIRVGLGERALPSDLGNELAQAARRMRRPLSPGKVKLSDAFVVWLDHATRIRSSDEANISHILTSRSDLRIIRPPLQSGPPLASYDPNGPEARACVEGVLKEMQAPMEQVETARRAWNAGDVAGALTAPRGIGWVCEVMWPGFWERSVGFHVEAIAMGLEMQNRMMAAIDMGELVAQDGVLARLRDRGYEVSGPLQPTEP